MMQTPRGDRATRLEIPHRKQTTPQASSIKQYSSIFVALYGSYVVIPVTSAVHSHLASAAISRSGVSEVAPHCRIIPSMSLSGRLLEALDHKQQVAAYTAQYPNARPIVNKAMAVPPPTPLRSVENGVSGGTSARQAAIQGAQNQTPHLQSSRGSVPQQTGQNGRPAQEPFKQQYIISGPPQFTGISSEAYGQHHGMVNPYMPSPETQPAFNPYMTQVAPAANASYRSNGFGNGGGFTAPMLMSEYTAGQIATLQSRLAKKLGPEYITKRPGPGGGPKLR